MFCGNCGKELPENAKFCSKCGEPTGAAEEKQQDAGAAAQGNDEEKVVDGIEKSVQSKGKGKKKKFSKRKKLRLCAAVLAVAVVIFMIVVHEIPIQIYSGNGYWLGEYTYDREGNLLTLTFTDYYRGSRETTIEEYDSEGNIVYEEMYGRSATPTAPTYKWWSYTDDGVAYLHSEGDTVYDSDGNELTYKSKYYCEDGSISIWEERNSKDGILQNYSDVRYYDTNEISSERYETYDDFGNILTDKYVSYDEKGNIGTYKNYNYSYDEYGNVLKRISYNADNAVTEEISYDYKYIFNNDGSVNAVVKYILNDEGERGEHWEERSGYDYDEAGNVIAETCIFKNYVEEYSYDSSGNLLAYTKYAAEDYAANETVLKLEEYTYDSDGNMLTEIYRENHSDGSEYIWHEYNYYSNGQKSFEMTNEYTVRYYEKGERNTRKSDYSDYYEARYDIYGNCLTSRLYLDGRSIAMYINYSYNNLGMCTEYSLTYYEGCEMNTACKYKYKYTYDESGNVLTAKRKKWEMTLLYNGDFGKNNRCLKIFI